MKGMKGMKRKVKEKLLAHGIRYMDKQGVGRVKLSHMKTVDLINATAALDSAAE